MLNRRWLAGAVLGAFLTVTAGAFTPQAEASPLAPTAVQTAVSEVSLAKHHGDHKPPKHDKFDKHDKKKFDKHDKKYDKKKHDKKKHDKKRDKHKKYDRHDRDRYDRDRHDRPHHHRPAPPHR